MRLFAIGALTLSGCLVLNPGFDPAASEGATGDGTGGATGAVTTGTSDMSSTTGTSDASGSASASTGDATTGAPPVGPVLCGAPFDPAAIQPASEVAELNSDGLDRDMWLSADGLTIYFSSNRGGPDESFRATRPAVGQPFGAVVKNDDIGLSAGSGELKIALSGDGLSAALSVGDPDFVIVAAGRAGLDQPFGARTPIALQYPGATGYFDPHLSPDGGRLYAAPTLSDDQTIAGWHLSGGGAPVAMDPDPFAAVNALPGTVADPSLSADELLLIFNHQPEGQDHADLWYATRDALDAAFSDPAPLDVLNTGAQDGSPHISADGCEIFISRDPNLDYEYDIYRAAVIP